MSFKSHYYRISDKVKEDKKFLASYYFLDVNTDLMEDEDVIRKAVLDYLDGFSTWAFTPSAGEEEYRTGSYWYLPCFGGDRNTPPSDGIIDGDRINVLTRDHIQLPYFLGTRLKLNLDEFCDIVYYEEVDSWVWPLMMEFINKYVADGILAAKSHFFDVLINGSYATEGQILFPALKDIKSYQTLNKYFSPPYLYNDTDDIVKLDQGRNIMYLHFKAMFENCERITKFLEGKNLVNNDIYNDFLYLQGIVMETMALAKEANAYQLHAYFTHIIHVYKLFLTSFTSR